MNLLNYIQGERRGKKAHQLEQESMHDPFLSDAIDGYDKINDDPVYHLKTLRRQILKRSRKKTYRIQLWNIAACVLVVICFGAIFFLKDTNRLEEISYVENQTKGPIIEEFQNQINESSAANDTILVIHEEEKEVIEKTPEKEKIKGEVIQREKVDYFSQTEEIQTAFRDKNENTTLTNAEIQAILLGENPEEFPEKTDEPNFQTPKPTIGESAYKEYLEKNRKLSIGSACESRRGKVILLFQVNEKGRPAKISVLRSLCQAADNEAVRLLQNGPDWTISERNTQLEILF